ncbi:MAG TPA: DsbA family protein [Patescibacteria group bacterium]
MHDGKIIAGVIAVTVLILGGIFAFGGSSAPKPADPLVVASPELIREHTATVGGGEKVTLVEFGDFQCPACGSAYPVLKQIKADYGDRITFAFRNYPLTIHANAELAAYAAQAAAEQGKFWEMHDKLFETQSAWSLSFNPENTFVGYATGLGLDEAKFRADIKNQAVIDKVRLDKGDGEALKVNSTPTLFLNGAQIPSSWSYESLKSLIDQELAK